jgi:hypothetical protein
MTLKRKQRMSLPRISLTGLQDPLRTSVLERYVNHILDVIQDQGVVLPSRDPSQDPEDGELLFYDEKLYLSKGGLYYQVYPATTSPVVLPETGDEEEGEVTVADNFPFNPETVLWVGIDLAPDTANQAVIAAVSNKKITIGYIEVNNPDTAEDTDVYFHFSSDGSTTKLCRKSVPHSGGTVVQNFIAIQPQGPSGIGFYATTAGSATADLRITVGYVLRD